MRHLAVTMECKVTLVVRRRRAILQVIKETVSQQHLMADTAPSLPTFHPRRKSSPPPPPPLSTPTHPASIHPTPLVGRNLCFHIYFQSCLNQQKTKDFAGSSQAATFQYHKNGDFTLSLY